jgi:hypothetical protein
MNKTRCRKLVLLSLKYCWSFYIGRLDKLSSTIQDAGIFSGQLILIEKRTPEGMWPV